MWPAMLRNRSALTSSLRAAVVLVVFAVVLCADGFEVRGLAHLPAFHQDLLKGLLALFVLGACLPPSVWMRPLVALLLLSADALAIGTIGTYLDGSAHDPFARASIPYLAGYLVAMLVAMGGRRAVGAALGSLAGVMILVLGESVMTHAPAGSTPLGNEDALLAFRGLLIATAAIECSIVTTWIETDGLRRKTAASIEREMRAREAVASDMATYLGQATSAASVGELGEALIQHLRRHAPTKARAVVLESGGEAIAIWEEAGRLDDDDLEKRRDALQVALKDAGSTSVVERLDARSTTGLRATRAERLATSVGVPVNVGGRTAGVIFGGDPGRRALTPDALSALAETARQTAAAVHRLERRRDEQTRRTSILLGQMREGVLLIGPDGRVLMSNPAGRRALETLGQPVEGPLTLGELTSADLASVAPGSVRRAVVTAAATEGDPPTMAVAAVGVVDGGVRLGTLVTLSDVTEEEAARRRLMQAEKLSVVGQTLAGVAHELNNPLAAIVGYSDLLAESAVPPDVARLLGRIREQSTRASRIVKNLLNVVRRRGPERTSVNLNEVVQSVVDLFAYDARLSNIVLLPVVDPNLPAVNADKHALQQIAVNLVQNAIHALRGKPGGGRVELRTSSDGAHVVLVVKDDGPGVPAEHRRKIFEAFFTTKGPGEGTGLGLSISRAIALDHGGDLALESEGTGATFTLRIPLTPGAVVAGPEPILAPETFEAPARVLVVDDEAGVRDSLAAQLSRHGTHVDAAGTPLEATRFLTSSPGYDAILLDVRLPGMNGIELHRGMRTRCPDVARRVVFMTGDLVNDDVIRSVKETGNPLLEKPFSFDELRRALAKVSGKEASASERVAAI